MVRHYATCWYSGKKHKVSCNPNAVKEYLVGLKKQPLSKLKQKNK